MTDHQIPVILLRSIPRCIQNIHPFSTLKNHPCDCKPDTLFQRQNEINVGNGKIPDKSRQQAKRNSEDPGSDLIYIHYIFGLSTAAKDAAAHNHVLDLEGCNHCVCEQNLPCNLLYRVLDLINLHI